MNESDRPDIEARLAALEERAATGDRLRDGVERLSGETSSLNAILTRVDDNQQRLAVLDANLGTMQKIIIPREELDDARDGLRQRIFVTSLFLLVTIVVVGAVLLAYNARQQADAQRICQERNQAAKNILLYIEDEKKITQRSDDSPDVKRDRLAALDRFAQSYTVVDCNSNGDTK